MVRRKKYQKSIWMNLTSVVLFTTTFLTSPSPSSEQYQLAEAPTKNHLQSSCSFCDLKTQQRYILQEEVNISKREPTRLLDGLRDFLKTFDQASKCIKIPLQKPKVEIGYTESKDNLFAHFYNDIIEHPNTQIRLSFRFGNNNCCVFSIKKFESHGNSFLQIFTTLTIAKFIASTRIVITLETSVK